MQRDIKLTSVLKGELDIAKAKNKALLQQGKAIVARLILKLKTIKANAKTLQKEAKQVYSLKIELNDLRIALQATRSMQAKLDKIKQDLEDLRQVLSLY